MRVFISSTCFDLLDVRAELIRDLQEMGVIVSASDDHLSDFDVPPDMNSIEACLANVRNSDEVVVILDQRYGPKLDVAGYAPISATHLEYQTAQEEGIPVRFFVRDRLEADAVIYRRNKGQEMKLAWVKPADYPLFNLLEEHKELRRESTTSNWRTIFRTSVDLRQSVRKLYGVRVGAKNVLDAINQNRFPILYGTTSASMTSQEPTVTFQFELKNIGGAPAFSIVGRWADGGPLFNDDGGILQILGPSESRMAKYGRKGIRGESMGLREALELSYLSAIGVRVSETWIFWFRAVSSALLTGAKLEKRTYTLDDSAIVVLAGTE